MSDRRSWSISWRWRDGRRRGRRPRGRRRWGKRWSARRSGGARLSRSVRRGCLCKLHVPATARTPKIVGVQGCSPRNSFEIDSYWNHLPIVQRARYEARLNSPLMPDYPQVNIDGIGVFFLVEFQLSFDLSFLACDGDFTGEVHELQLPTRDRSRCHSRPSPEEAQDNRYCYRPNPGSRHFLNVLSPQ